MAREPIHPGEFLQDDLQEIGMTATELSRQLGVPPNRISQILRGKRDVSADTALRLGKFFGTGPELWMNLQYSYDLDQARIQIGTELGDIPCWHKDVLAEREAAVASGVEEPLDWETVKKEIKEELK